MKNFKFFFNKKKIFGLIKKNIFKALSYMQIKKKYDS